MKKLSLLAFSSILYFILGNIIIYISKNPSYFEEASLMTSSFLCGMLFWDRIYKN